MTPENKHRQAKALGKNEYLRLLFEDRADELREDWEATEPSEAETREQKYVALKALTELKDFIYARISADTGDGVT